jgi:hypothetical protein
MRIFGSDLEFYTILLLVLLKRDSVTRFSTSGFFLESVSPMHLSITSRPFRIFSKIRGGILGSRSGLEKTRVFLKKPSPVGFFGFLFGFFWVFWVFLGFFAQTRGF